MSMPIIVTKDGTGNNLKDFIPTREGEKFIDRNVTNVLKLHFLAGGDINLERHDVPGQLCLYQRGVGGVSDNVFIKTINFAFGELSQQTKPMRKKLEAIYEKGDKLYIIGMSRGSAAAREFVVELEKDGLLTKSNEKVEKPPVEFLGCFDTISMQWSHFFNIPFVISRSITKSSILGEKGGKIPSIVKKAVHLISLDDNRNFKLLSPVHMDSNDERQRVHEMFVPGDHQDCGGSWYIKGIPDCSCKCMQEFLEDAGISFISNKDLHPDSLELKDDPDVKIDKKDLDMAPDPSAQIHQTKDQLQKPSYRPVVTVTNEEIIKGGTVRIHLSVLQHMEAMEKLGTPYPINPRIKDTDLVVVGPLDKPLEAETKRLKELLAR